ncbi:hypothetical protein I350_03889 [Cryptococcus amylolentus CBS 6273]|uniref:Uncharacterized protein n=1 Tax=Cryptococcus amylolentus CBS 6273 TaxID=1296118 RepID=A0A1E3K084_9TREE|nr:hypothetical protein I350_03889 [Cryptococcus amylolentus CBS 6273]
MGVATSPPPHAGVDPSSPPPPSPTPWQLSMYRLSPGERLLYYLYLPLLSTILILLALLASLPYMFCKRSRPLLPKRSPPDPKHPESKYEWYGPEKDYPPGLALAPLGKGPGLKRRMWEMYGYFREFWYMTTRQGLQVKKYQDALSGGDAEPSDYSKSDDKCAYIVGTGIANWGDLQEPLAWYGCYHGFLCLLCICLIGDELFNVRFGAFAPQWFRGGIGYTIMFLVSATLSTSPNWGINDFIQLRYLLLTVIFLFGLYQVLRTLASSIGITTSGYRHTDYRIGRKPLRPWTQSEWLDPYYRQNFIPFQFDRYFWTERVQAKIGDWNFPAERRPREDVEEQMEWLERNSKGGDRRLVDMRVQKVYQKTPQEIKWQHGKIGRIIIHGGPKKMPPFMLDDLQARERAHLGQLPSSPPPTSAEQDEIIKAWNEDKSYFGIANWKPKTKSFGWWWFDVRRAVAVVCALGLMGVRIGLCIFDLASSNMHAYRQEYDQAQDTWDSTDSGGPDGSTCQYYQGSSLAIFVVLGEESYYGVTAKYVPPPLLPSLPPPPAPNPQANENKSMIWLAIWHLHLLGMCTAIILVAISNNMWWGMHWPFPPITLIGPRMTSMSIGVTMGFVAFATLQQGFFFGNDSLIVITRSICYASVVGFILFLYPNEPLRINYTRDPFWPWTSRVAFRFMDRKKVHYELKDFDDAQG